MDHEDHVYLLRGGVQGVGGTWADLGSGRGAFTLALADLIGHTGHIYSVDKDQRALREQERAMSEQFPLTNARYIATDFTKPFDLPPLDGVVMANSLHFLRNKDEMLQLVRGYLKPGGHLVLVEYNSDRGNMWVPYPLSFETWQKLAHQNGFTSTRLLAKVPSRFLGEMYAAMSIK